MKQCYQFVTGGNATVVKELHSLGLGVLREAYLAILPITYLTAFIIEGPRNICDNIEVPRAALQR